MARPTVDDFQILSQLHAQLQDPDRNSEVWDSELEREISRVEARIKSTGGTPPPRPGKMPSRTVPEAIVTPVALNEPAGFENKNPAVKGSLVEQFGLNLDELKTSSQSLIEQFGIDPSTLEKDEKPRRQAKIGTGMLMSDVGEIRPEVVQSVPFHLGSGSAESYARLRAAMSELDVHQLDKVGNLIERLGTDAPPTVREITDVANAKWQAYLGHAINNPELKKTLQDELKAYRDLAVKDQTIYSDIASSTALEAAERTPPDATFLEKATISAARSAGPSLAAAAVPGAAPARVVAGAGAALGATFGHSFAEAEETAKQKGLTLTVDQKRAFATIDSVFEGAGEAFGLRVALKVGLPFFERVVKAVAANATEEMAVSLMQDAHKAIVLDPEMTAKEFLYNAVLSGTAGAIGGAAIASAAQLQEIGKPKTEDQIAAEAAERILKGEPQGEPTPPDPVAPQPEPQPAPPVDEVQQPAEPTVEPQGEPTPVPPGAPAPSTEETFLRQLLKNDVLVAAEHVDDYIAKNPEAKLPYQVAVEMHAAGELTAEKLGDFRQALTQNILAKVVVAKGAEIAETADQRDKLQEELESYAKEKDDYVPTAEEASDLDFAIKIHQKYGGKKQTTEEVRQMMLEIGGKENGSRFLQTFFQMFGTVGLGQPAEITARPYERKDFEEVAKGDIAKYFLVLAHRQAHGMYPFAATRAGMTTPSADYTVMPWIQPDGTRQVMRDLPNAGVGRAQARYKNENKGQQAARLVTQWLKTFAPDARVMIVDRANVAPFDATAVNGAPGTGFNETYAPGESLIYVDADALTEAGHAEVLAHEFGHFLVKRYLAQMPKSVQLAVQKAWAKETKKVMNVRLADAMRQRRGPWGFQFDHSQDPGQGTVGENMSRPFIRGYLLGFEEWMAHQMERVMTNNDFGMLTPVKVFFKKAAAQLQKWFDKFGADFAPNKTFLDFIKLGVLYEKSQAQQREALDSAQAMLKDYGMEQLREPEAKEVGEFLRKAFATLKATPEVIAAYKKASPEVVERAANAVKRLGMLETSFFLPERPGTPVDAMELTTTLEDAWLPGQPKDVIERTLSASPLPTSKPASRIASALKNYFKYSKFGKHVDSSEYQGHLDKFSWMRKKIHSLEHWAKANPHIEQLQRYVEGVREWHRDRMAWISRADGRLKEWRKLTPDDQKALGRLLLDEAQAGKYFDLNDAAVLQKYPLTAAAREMHAQINSDFVDFLSALEATLVAEAAKRLTKDPISAATEMQRIRERFAELKKIPQFPLSRFGRHMIVVTSKGVTTVKGKTYEEGEVIHLEAFDTKLGLYAEYDRIKGAYPNGVLKIQEVKENISSLIGMPTVLLDALKNNKDVGLTDEQKKAIDEYLYQLAPAQSFTRHLSSRKTVEGYTEDVMRAYSDYFFHGASHLARVKHSGPLADEIAATDITAELIEGNSAKRTAIANYMREHFKYIMSPENDWSSVRAAVAVMYLAAVPRTAFMNLTQVPMVTYPHLAAKYGDGKALRALQKAYGDSIAMYHVAKNLTQREEEAITRWSQGQPLQPGDEKIVTAWSKLESNVRLALRRGVAEGFIDESMAMELAAMSEGSWLTRFKATNKAGYYWRAFSHYAMVPFQAAEKLNRRVTFVAAFRLAKQAGANDEQAYEAGREAVSASQYEYAKWNRPELLRGKKGIFFMFWQYMLNTMYFAFGGDKGWWRWWIMMLAAVGPMGLPFAENIMDLITWIGQKLQGPDKRFDAEYEAKKALGEFADVLGVKPDLLMHGLSRYGFGLVPFADLSGSMSMSRILPGTGLLSDPGGDWRAMVTKGVSEAGGASTSLVMRMLQAAVVEDENVLRRIEKGMPVTFAQQVLGAARWYKDQAVETHGGADIVKFDTNDPWHLMEIAGKALGFQPRRVGEAREELALENDFKKFFMLRRQALKGKLDYELEKGDNETVGQVMEAIQRFNNQAPPGLAISASEVRESRVARVRARQMLEQGLDTQKRYIPLQQSIRDRSY